MASTATMLDLALAYLRRGLPVFPVCQPIPRQEGVCKQHGDHGARNRERAARGVPPLADPGKHPLVQWGAFQKRLPTEDEVTTWWARWPTANIGMATGRLSGLVVLDSDGMDAYTAVLSRGGVEPTPTVVTGKPNGFHWYLAHPGRPVRNFAGDRGVEGLDFRGDGGYVVLPPSLHRSGVFYSWHAETEHEPPQPVPEWLLALLTDGRRSPASNGTTNGTIGGSGHEPLSLERILSGIPEGERDDTIFRFAGKLRGENVPIAYAELMVRQAARLCHPPFDESAAVEKIHRAYELYQPSPVLDASGLDAVETPEDWEWVVYDAAEFLKRELPPIQWILEGYLRERAIVFLFGAPGALKTYVATDMALAIATGTDFLSVAAVRGKVLIIQEDTIEQDYQQTYLRPMVKARGLTADHLTGRLFIAPPADLLLDVPQRVERLEAWLEEHHPALVVTDAFYLLHSGDGVTDKELAPIMRTYRRLRDKYGCSFIVIDHDRKSPGGARNSDENSIDRLVGGRRKSASSDAVIEALPVKGDIGVTYLHVRKLRGARQPEPVRVRYREGLLHVDGSGKESVDGSAGTVHEWLYRQGAGRTVQQIANGAGLSVRAVEAAIGELFREGRVQRVGKQGRAYVWTTAVPTEDDPWRQ